LAAKLVLVQTARVGNAMQLPAPVAAVVSRPRALSYRVSAVGAALAAMPVLMQTMCVGNAMRLPAPEAIVVSRPKALLPGLRAHRVAVIRLCSAGRGVLVSQPPSRSQRIISRERKGLEYR